MAGEGFEVEEWDADFLDQLVQAEELALSSSVPNATQHSHHHHHPAVPYANDISYSPPRELSQRVRDTPAAFGHGHSSLDSTSFVHGNHNAKEQEIDTLKRELGRVSKQLSLLEEECLELKKERDKKEEQLKFVSTAEAKDAEDCGTNSKNLHSGVGIQYDHGIPQEHQKGKFSNELLGLRLNLCNSASKAIGVQTDKDSESDNSSSKCDLFVAHNHQSKLLGIWDSHNSQKFGRDLVLKLFATCEVDLQVLFGHLNLSQPSNIKIGSSHYKSDLAPSDHQKSAVAAKVSQLYFTLTKISDEMVRWDALLEALINLCHLENGVIVYRSLRVLHVVLKQAFSTKMTFTRRDNVLVVGHFCENTPADICEHQSFDNGSQHYAHAKKILDQCDFQHGAKLCHAKRNLFTPNHTVSISHVDLSSLFELMCQITVRNLEEPARLEAVSIMNTVVVSHNAYSEREKFASALVFQSISQLLRKEAGFLVRRQAVTLLYKLLNCPKVTAAFCSGYQEGGESAVTAEVDVKTNSTFQEFGAIMEGLVDCVACSENIANELKLRRSAITLVAFLASLGKSGFAILLNHRLPRSSILVCVLQSLKSDVDQEALDSAPSSEVFKERTLLLREGLILLNRVVSHPQFSVPVLQSLTGSREMTSLTIDVAKRLSQKSNCIWQDDCIARQIRESEIVELARVFKRRVSTFLGDNMS